MSLSVTNIGDNTQAPGAWAESYLPDQLIAGKPQLLVTDSVTITGGADLVRGTLLGQITIGTIGAATAGGGNTGNGTISAITAGAKTKVGTYTIRFTGATTYTITNPNGVALTPGVAAGAYTDAELNFTFTAGGTPMVAGDTFTIAVAAGSGSYQKAVSTAVDGSQNPIAILAADALCSTAGADQVSGIYLMGEFNSAAMTFGSGFTAASAKPLLQPLGIFLKSAVTASDPS